MGETGNHVPGFDFLQGLVKSAGSAVPGMNAWMAPTLDPDELQKRIDELRTVQFWLEQNVKMIGHSIQALEVQRMTLATLKGMNLKVADLGEAFKLKVPGDEERDTSDDSTRTSATATEQAAADKPASAKVSGASPAAPAAAGLVDPTQWWAALTQQFTEIAAKALPAGGQAAATSMASAVGQAVQQQVELAQQTAAQAVNATAELPQQRSKSGAKPARKSARAPAKKASARKA